MELATGVRLRLDEFRGNDDCACWWGLRAEEFCAGFTRAGDWLIFPQKTHRVWVADDGPIQTDPGKMCLAPLWPVWGAVAIRLQIGESGVCYVSQTGKHRSAARRRKAVLKEFRRQTGVGAIPGTIAASPPAGECRLTRLTYSATEVNEEELPDHTRLTSPGNSDGVTWIRVQGQPDSATLHTLARLFGIHSLALEDVQNSHQRCKVEDYGSHLYVVSRLPRFLDDGRLVTEQVNLFIGVHFLISIHDGPDFLGAVRERIIRSRTRIRELPADYLGYAVLDTVTDHYFPVVEQIGNRLNRVDEMMEDGVHRKQRSEIRDLRSDLLLLRRSIWPQRDALSALMRDDCEVISPATRTYLRDCYDHTVQIIDVTETYRELCADLRDFHLSEITYRSSEVMKSLTIIATVFMPLSFVAGFYGMNFRYMPELSLRYGYPAAVLLMLSIAGSLMYWFYRKGWLTSSGGQSDGESADDSRPTT